MADGSTITFTLTAFFKSSGLEEKDLKEMLRFANAAASLITTRKGALRVMPEREEIEKML